MNRLRRYCFPALLLCLSAPALAQFEQRGSVAYGYPGPIAVGDFNGDGKLDIVTAGAFDSDVTVLLGNGDGTFRAPVLYPAGAEPETVATADLRGNRKLDLVVGNFLSGNISVLLGNGDGTFQAPVNYDTPASGDVNWIGVGDFNGDGKLDIVALDQQPGCGTGSGGCVLVYLGNGDGTFQSSPIIVSTDTSLSEFAVGDFDNDGKLDLAVTENNFTTSGVQIFLGNGDGTFRAGAVYPYFGPLLAERLTKSRNLDLVISGVGLDILLGNGNGTFQNAIEYQQSTMWLAVADFNGDKIPDIVATEDNTGKQALLYIGNGDGTFQPAITFGTPREPSPIAAGDFNGDHRPDIVFADGKSGANFIATMLNTGPAYFSPDTPLSFGMQAVGTTSAPQTVTLTNTGKSALTISAMKASAEFGVKSTCGANVAAGAKCSINVTFTPTSTGAKSGIVSIHDSASSKPQVIELSGTGD